MTFKTQSIPSAVQDSLHKSRAWARRKLAERIRAAHHHDPVSTVPRGHLLGMLVSMR